MMTATPTARTAELLTILQLPRVGPAKAFALLDSAPESSLTEAAAHALTIDEEGLMLARDRAETIMNACSVNDITILGFEDAMYPPLLRRIPDAPPILYVRGRVEALSRPAVAVVGTRNASRTGCSIARTIARYLARRGITVVSGLAIGIDTCAHLGALDEAGTTVAVLAHGLHTVTPPRNRELAERILEEGGTWVAEHPPGTRPFPQEFVRRNRIQSGLSIASVIVESRSQGGAIHQARFTVKQHRKLLAVGGTPSGEAPDLEVSGALYLQSAFQATIIRSTEELDRELQEISPRLPEPIAEQQRLSW